MRTKTPRWWQQQVGPRDNPAARMKRLAMLELEVENFRLHMTVDQLAAELRAAHARERFLAHKLSTLQRKQTQPPAPPAGH